MDLSHNEKQAVEVHLNFLQLQSLLRLDNTGLTTSPYRLRQCVTLGNELLLFVKYVCEKLFWKIYLSMKFFSIYR